MLKPKPEKDEKTGRFVSGNIGGGRPKGSRNQLGEAFIDDLYAHWKIHGVAAIAEMCAGGRLREGGRLDLAARPECGSLCDREQDRCRAQCPALTR
jgi:hypothetical protein